MGKKNAKLKSIRRKVVGRAPNYLKTAAISLPSKKPRIKGTFGAASEGVRIDPETYLGSRAHPHGNSHG